MSGNDNGAFKNQEGCQLSIVERLRLHLQRPQLFQSFWHGGQLNPVAWTCYHSFIGGGQRVDLYTYDEIEVPKGVRLKCADEIIPRDALFRKLDSWSPFSNFFRYELLFQRGGWWIDSDVYYNRKMIPKDDVIFAEQERGVVNTGQLKFPKAHPVLSDLISRCRTFDLEKIKWGETGPRLLTATLRDHQLQHKGIEREMLYPLHWLETYKFWFAEFSDYVKNKTKSSPFIHLWTSRFRALGIDVERERPLPGSFLDNVYDGAGVYRRYHLSMSNLHKIRERTNRYLNNWSRYSQSPHFLDLTPV